jgi:HSP20 family protein
MLIRRVGSWPFEKGYTNEFSEWDRLRKELGQLLDPRRSLMGGDLPAGVFPLLNVTQDHDHFYVRSEIPGMTLDELEVSVTGRTVTIAGERIDENGKRGNFADNSTYPRMSRVTRCKPSTGMAC